MHGQFKTLTDSVVSLSNPKLYMDFDQRFESKKWAGRNIDIAKKIRPFHKRVSPEVAQWSDYLATG